MKTQEEEKQELIQNYLLKEEIRSFEDLIQVQKFIQKYNNAEISLKKKTKGPAGYHLQCIHFKSKKCPYRIRFLRQTPCHGQEEASYYLEDYSLVHENHTSYEERDKVIRDAKKTLEVYRSDIIKIYLQLLQEGNEKMLKPTKIKQILEKNLNINIYGDHTDKEICEKIKKKLDNIIRDFKQQQKKKEKLCGKGEQSNIKILSNSNLLKQNPESKIKVNMLIPEENLPEIQQQQQIQQMKTLHEYQPKSPSVNKQKDEWELFIDYTDNKTNQGYENMPSNYLSEEGINFQTDFLN